MSIVSIVATILILGILIFIHEFGHFFIARRNGIRVIEFAIGLGPTIFKIHDKKGTDYCIKLLPFGGYCRMQGFEDESLDDEEHLELNPNEAFSSKSVWARIAVVCAGPIFNFLLAWVFSLVIISIVGYDPAEITYVKDGSVADEAGLTEGDVITSFNGSTIHFGREIYLETYINPLSDEEIEIIYERDGKEYTVSVTPEYIEKYVIGIEYSLGNETAVIDSVVDGGAFDGAGVLAGDVIVNVNGTDIETSEDLYNYFTSNPLTGEEITVTLLRDSEEYTVTVTPVYSTSYYSLGFSYNTYRVKTNAWGVIKYSFYDLKYSISTVVRSLGMLFTGKLSVNDLSGPVGIADVVNDTYEASKSDGIGYVLLNFMNLSVIISANLGVMNLLPIPGLDGGRLLFLIIEAIRRKPIDKKKEGIVHLIGILLLFALAVYVLFHDISSLFK